MDHQGEGQTARHPGRWWVLAALMSVAALCSLFGAGMALSAAGLGGSIPARGCNSSLVGGLTLLILTGLLVGAVRIVVDRRHVGHELSVDWARVAACLPVPIAGLALAAPNFLACSAAGRLDQWGRIGRALLGTPGIAVASASAILLGLVVTWSIRVGVPHLEAAMIYEYEEPSQVDQVLADVEARRAAADDEPYRGVES